MRGKAFALSFLAFFTVVAISPNLSTFLVSAAKVQRFSGLGHHEAHIFLSIHIVPDSDEGEEILFSVR